MNPHSFPRLVACALALAFANVAFAEETPAPPAEITRYVAIDNVCAWPNLKRLADGSLAALIFNQPSHGQMEGAVECWLSERGEFWHKAGTPAPHEPQTNRMNHAAGLAVNGDLVVLCSGWANFQQEGRPKQNPFRDAILRPWVCRSSDGGRTWKQTREFPAGEPGRTEYIPFGDIWPGDDKALHVSCYDAQYTEPEKSSKTTGWKSWHFRSEDDGQTWQRVSLIGPKHNETDLFPLGGKRWLAAARADAMDLFRSDDDGATWTEPQRVTARSEINGHLLRLKDGRLLLTYGSRVKGALGVLAKLSSDEGHTWGAPIRIATSLNADCGYPSSVQRSDRRIVTAYYSRAAENHQRYHMGVAIWAAPE